ITTPQAIADHDNRVTPRSTLVDGQERAPQRRVYPQHLKVVTGDDFGEHRPGTPPSAEAAREHTRAEQTRECAIVLAQVSIVGIRDGEVAAGAGFRKDDAEP